MSYPELFFICLNCEKKIHIDYKRDGMCEICNDLYEFKEISDDKEPNIYKIKVKKSIINNNLYSLQKDIIKINQYFEIFNPHVLQSGGVNIVDIHIFLSKYNDTKFYLTFDIDDKGRIYHWKIHTEKDIYKLLPTGIELHKITFYKDIRPLQTLINYKNFNTTSQQTIEGLTFYHDNLYYVHPQLVDLSKFILF
jgi:hypothetical protein